MNLPVGVLRKAEHGLKVKSTMPSKMAGYAHRMANISALPVEKDTMLITSQPKKLIALLYIVL
ncbi:MAG: hypothetical protein ACXV8O_11570 [Methylobacter sp.]